MVDTLPSYRQHNGCNDVSHEWISSFKSRNNESQLSQTRILFSILTVGQLLPNLIDKTIGTVSQWQRGGFRRFIAELMRFVARYADHGAGNQRRPPERVASNIFPPRVVFMVALVSGGDSPWSFSTSTHRPLLHLTMPRVLL